MVVMKGQLRLKQVAKYGSRAIFDDRLVSEVVV